LGEEGENFTGKKGGLTLTAQRNKGEVIPTWNGIKVFKTTRIVERAGGDLIKMWGLG